MTNKKPAIALVEWTLHPTLISLISRAAVLRHHTTAATATNLFGCNDAGAIGSDQTRLVLANQGALHLDHIVLGHALGDADNQRNFGIECLHDGSSGTWWRHIDDRGMWIRCLFRFRNGGKDRQAQMLSAALFGWNAANQLGAILQRLLAVKGALFAGESLTDDTGVAVQLEIRTRLVVLRAAANAGSEAIWSKDANVKRSEQCWKMSIVKMLFVFVLLFGSHVNLEHGPLPQRILLLSTYTHTHTHTHMHPPAAAAAAATSFCLRIHLIFSN